MEPRAPMPHETMLQPHDLQGFQATVGLLLRDEYRAPGLVVPKAAKAAARLAARQLVRQKDVRSALCPLIQRFGTTTSGLIQTVIPALLDLMDTGTITVPMTPLLSAFIIREMQAHGTQVCADKQRHISAR